MGTFMGLRGWAQLAAGSHRRNPKGGPVPTYRPSSLSSAPRLFTGADFFAADTAAATIGLAGGDEAGGG
ncbi:MAG: hypothetical protein HUU22_11955, partial [Phycisphaerae bacterium]|nr:hypothetical protein [Phycisphaerae bacterium]